MICSLVAEALVRANCKDMVLPFKVEKCTSSTVYSVEKFRENSLFSRKEKGEEMQDKEAQNNEMQDRNPCFDCPSHGIDKQCACALTEELETAKKAEKKPHEDIYMKSSEKGSSF